jgi:hypothetical protein
MGAPSRRVGPAGGGVVDRGRWPAGWGIGGPLTAVPEGCWSAVVGAGRWSGGKGGPLGEAGAVGGPNGGSGDPFSRVTSGAAGGIGRQVDPRRASHGGKEWFHRERAQDLPPRPGGPRSLGGDRLGRAGADEDRGRGPHVGCRWAGNGSQPCRVHRASGSRRRPGRPFDPAVGPAEPVAAEPFAFGVPEGGLLARSVHPRDYRFRCRSGIHPARLAEPRSVRLLHRSAEPRPPAADADSVPMRPAGPGSFGLSICVTVMTVGPALP